MNEAVNDGANGSAANGAGKAGTEEDRAPMSFAVRIFVYFVGVHIIAAFLFGLFYLGGAK
ncbi:DUF6126 family protein [Streptomyces sp. LX-29]|uniref:DUF6126 family protein n=1 Tax=Streptomyces sp. LX-29 TaxID=2900152 RepID=UPI00240E9602|nr:DUF6126 family protein [Streptomyces sp. LX-29]WFB06824.1 DUF6126 family protein [Streptomyces sp. LX-29]